MNIEIKDIINGCYISPDVAQIIAELNKQNIVRFESGEFYINSGNYAGHELVNNVDEKIYYILYNWDFFNLEGAAKIITIRRRLTGLNQIIYYKSLSNTSSIPNTDKINPILCSSIAIAGAIANPSTCLLFMYYKITVQ